MRGVREFFFLSGNAGAFFPIFEYSSFWCPPVWLRGVLFFFFVFVFVSLKDECHSMPVHIYKKDRVFCLCAQSRENKKVKKCVKLKYGCCG